MSTGTEERYFRPPLEDASTQIRLLKIHAAHHGNLEADVDETLRCELAVCNLTDVEGQYVAISYTWGPESLTNEIDVNRTTVTVRQNCWYALRQMRAHNADIMYWIDSLCIDQGSPLEKRQQVRRMGDIYARAKIVAACLGGKWENGELAFPHPRDSSYQSKLQSQLIVDALASRPYFRRLWTVQECLMAPEGALLFLIGDCSISWEVFCARYFIARGSRQFAWQGELYKMLMDIFLYRKRDNHQHLWNVIKKYSHRLCEDPRDKVYGLLTLVRPSQARQIKIDYTKTLLSVLVDVARGCQTSFFLCDFDDEHENLMLALQILVVEFAKACAQFRQDVGSLIRSHGFGVGVARPDDGRPPQPLGNVAICQCKKLPYEPRLWVEIGYPSWLREDLRSSCDIILWSFAMHAVPHIREGPRPPADGPRTLEAIDRICSGRQADYTRFQYLR